VELVAGGRAGLVELVAGGRAELVELVAAVWLRAVVQQQLKKVKDSDSDYRSIAIGSIAGWPQKGSGYGGRSIASVSKLVPEKGNGYNGRSIAALVSWWPQKGSGYGGRSIASVSKLVAVEGQWVWWPEYSQRQ
jgi:hypothetical protein